MNIKELKEKIEEEAQEDYDFEQRLFKKYPNLFYKGEDEELLPQMQRCWNDCPIGWELLVENLFGSIDSYVKFTTKSSVNPKKKNKVWIYRNIVSKILTWLNRIFNPYHNSKIALNTIESAKQKANIYKLFSMKVRRFTSKVRVWFLSELYVHNNPAQVKITQYKEKFGTLRVYTDNADETVEGMIRFAEYLSSKTCQDTGQAGDLCYKGSWYTTLSPAKAAELGYKKYEKINSIIHQ